MINLPVFKNATYTIIFDSDDIKGVLPIIELYLYKSCIKAERKNGIYVYTFQTPTHNFAPTPFVQMRKLIQCIQFGEIEITYIDTQNVYHSESANIIDGMIAE